MQEMGMIVKSGYNRAKAVEYADTHWNRYNPYFRRFEVDCTSFVSQCLLAGGIPMEMSNNRSKGWWYLRRDGGKRDLWSYSWAVAHALFWYLNNKRSRAVRVERADQLQLGDVICYDWEGDGRWNHNTIVTRFDGSGQPLVNAHTFNSRHRYWEYKDSPAWTPRMKYAFFHIL